MSKKCSEKLLGTMPYSWTFVGHVYIIYYSQLCKKKTEVSSDNAREESNLAAVRKNDFMAASW